MHQYYIVPLCGFLASKCCTAPLAVFAAHHAGEREEIVPNYISGGLINLAATLRQLGPTATHLDFISDKESTEAAAPSLRPLRATPRTISPPRSTLTCFIHCKYMYFISLCSRSSAKLRRLVEASHILAHAAPVQLSFFFLLRRMYRITYITLSQLSVFFFCQPRADLFFLAASTFTIHSKGIPIQKLMLGSTVNKWFAIGFFRSGPGYEKYAFNI